MDGGLLFFLSSIDSEKVVIMDLLWYVDLIIVNRALIWKWKFIIITYNAKRSQKRQDSAFIHRPPFSFLVNAYNQKFALSPSDCKMNTTVWFLLLTPIAAMMPFDNAILPQLNPQHLLCLCSDVIYHLSNTGMKFYLVVLTWNHHCAENREIIFHFAEWLLNPNFNGHAWN